jgi:arylsulfatase A
MDLLPTLAHITGAELKPYHPIDGKNITDLVTGKDGALTSYENFFYVNNAVRSGDWKYHAKEIFKVKKTARPSSGPTLYNLKEDIGESKNVLKNYPEVAERLKKALDQHKKYISSGK